MPDSPIPPQLPQTPQPPVAPPDAGHIPMSEEFDRAKWTLPPIVPVLIAAVAIAAVVAVVSFSTRNKPVISGSITKVVSVDQQGSTMVAVQVQIENKFDKQLWLKDVTSELETADGRKYNDHAAPAVDVDRYVKAYPTLKEAKAAPLQEELKIAPGASYTGYTVFAYPVDQPSFNGRKSLTVKIEMYDHPVIELRQ